jgi:hypothetical protein
MSNVSKTAKRNKIRSQIAELLAKLADIENETQYTQASSMGIMGLKIISCGTKYSRTANIKKRIDFLNRKLDKLA